MNDQFFLYFDQMPTGTAQEKGYNSITKTYYKKPNVESASAKFRAALFPHRPKAPSTKPIRLIVIFSWQIKDKKLWGKYKATRPDTDNYIKEFKDVMTKLKFWKDDAQVVDERIIKTYSEKAFIFVAYEELPEIADIRLLQGVKYEKDH